MALSITQANQVNVLLDWLLDYSKYPGMRPVRFVANELRSGRGRRDGN